MLFTITDAFIRRKSEQERVVGTLLGTIADGVVEVRNCYAVPHSESNESVRAAATPRQGAGGRRQPACRKSSRSSTPCRVPGGRLPSYDFSCSYLAPAPGLAAASCRCVL